MAASPRARYVLTNFVILLKLYPVACEISKSLFPFARINNARSRLSTSFLLFAFAAFSNPSICSFVNTYLQAIFSSPRYSIHHLSHNCYPLFEISINAIGGVVSKRSSSSVCVSGFCASGTSRVTSFSRKPDSGSINIVHKTLKME